ncbi:MAG: response regulator [Gemmatimonadetes bacterium]|mgnify:CR=1|nr:response regulator [Gemmatimonadota bacterium]
MMKEIFKGAESGDCSKEEASQLLIMIVDDRPANLYALENTLREVPARVLRAHSGEEALALTLDNEFALAILDVQMPEMNGYELAEMLRGDPATAHVPIIFVSAAYADEQHQFEGYEAGGVDYIVKPFDPAILLGKVRIFLELAQYRNCLERMVEERTEELRRSEEKYRLLAENIADVIWRMDRSGRLIYVSPSIESLTGFSSEEFMAISFEERYPPATQKDILGMLDEADEGKVEGAWCGEEELNRKDGTTVWTESRIDIVSDERGRTIGFVGITHDISARKRLECEREEYARALEESLAYQKSLLREVHHRVKNNLQVVMSLLRMQIRRSPSEACSRALQDVMGRLQAVSRVHDRLHAGCDPEEMDLGRYLEVLMEDLRPLLPDGVDLVMERVRVGADIGQIVPFGLIVNELVTNALQHAFPEGRPGVIRVGLNRNGTDELVVEVRDDGVGFPDEGSDDGDGIGMKLVAALTEQIGGNVEIGSSEVGTLIRVVCPVEGIEDN